MLRYASDSHKKTTANMTRYPTMTLRMVRPIDVPDFCGKLLTNEESVGPRSAQKRPSDDFTVPWHSNYYNL
jgi:hypothetical protein